MKFQFEIKNRAFFFASLMISFIIILAVAIAITAPNPGHTSSEVKIVIGGAEKTLQQAIDSGEIGGAGKWATTYAIRYVGCYRNNNVLDMTDAGCYQTGSIPSYLWETIDQTVNFPRDVGIRRVILTVTDIENTDWPALGTKYIFDGGADTTPVATCGGKPAANCLDNLPFNQEVYVWAYGSNYLYLTVNVVNSSNPGTIKTAPVSLRFRGIDYSPESAFVFLKVEYEYYYLTYDDVRIGELI